MFKPSTVTMVMGFCEQKSKSSNSAVVMRFGEQKSKSNYCHGNVMW